MAHELTLVSAYGEPTTVAQLLSPEYLNHLDDKQVEDLAYQVKEFKKPFKNVEETVKKRLDNGVHFENISYTTAKRSAVDQSDETKMAFVKKYGWGAVSVNTPAQLKREFGKAIEEDLEKVTVYSEQNRVKYQ